MSLVDFGKIVVNGSSENLGLKHPSNSKLNNLATKCIKIYGQMLIGQPMSENQSRTAALLMR